MWVRRLHKKLQWSQTLLMCTFKCTEILLVCMSIVCLWVWKKSRRSARTWVLWYTTVSKYGALCLLEGMTMCVLCAVNVLYYAIEIAHYECDVWDCVVLCTAMWWCQPESLLSLVLCGFHLLVLVCEMEYLLDFWILEVLLFHTFNLRMNCAECRFLLPVTIIILWIYTLLKM